MPELKIKKQERFCNEYIVDLNGSQAAIRSGYSKKSAKEQASALLTKHNIQERVSELLKKRSERTEVNQDRVLLEIARLAFNDPRKAFDENGNMKAINDWPDEVAAAISTIKVTEVNDDSYVQTTLKEIKFWDKGKQIELAGKHLGMFTDKIDHTSSDGTMSSMSDAELDSRIAELAKKLK